MWRSVVMILSGNAAASLLLLLRNLLLARLLPVADYGIAATFAMIMAVVEMASAFGLQQQIVQARDGDDPRFQAALQGFQLLRGLAAAAVLYAIAGPVAAFMGIPEVAWAYQMLALVPVLKGLGHFDIHRLNRRLVYGPLLLAGALPPLVSLLASWPLVLWLGDWRVMLWAVLLQVAVATLASHLLAERPWRVVFDRALYGGALRFGWPVLLNGILLFLVFQGDKILIGRELGMDTLAIFSMGMTLMLTPGLVFASSLRTFFLPRLAARRRPKPAPPEGEILPSPEAAAPAARSGVDPRFRQLALAASEISVLFGALQVLLAGLLGPWFVAVVLGAKYAALAPLLVWLAVLQSVRGLKTGASVVAMAEGQTGNALLANLLRVAVLPLAWLWLVQGGGLRGLLVIALLGELAGVALAFWLQQRRQGVAVAPLLPGLLAAGLGQLLLLLWVEASGSAPLGEAAWLAGGWLTGGWPPLLATVLFALVAGLAPACRQLLGARR